MKFVVKFGLIIILFALIGCNSNRGNDEMLLNKVDSLQSQNDSLKNILKAKDELPLISKSPQWYYPETDSRKLRELGVEDPENFIKNALLESKEIIPMDAVLGGTMHFNNVQLLGDKWIIADFEDGHVYGKAIFEYTIIERHNLNFKIIALSEN